MCPFRDNEPRKGASFTKREELLGLSGRNEERFWLSERLKTMSVREEVILAGVLQHSPAHTLGDAVNSVLAIQDHDVLMGAGDYRALGQYLCDNEWFVTKDEQAYLNMEEIGRTAAVSLPGVFVDGSYVRFPETPSAPKYDGANLTSLPDDGWSLRLKLTSPTCPEGVWLKLPDYSALDGSRPHEIAFALDRLGVKSISECTVTDGRCSVPGITGLEEEFGDPRNLVLCGNDLGYMLDREKGIPVHACRDMREAYKSKDFRGVAQAVGIAASLADGRDPHLFSSGLFKANILRHLDKTECLARLEQINLQGRMDDAPRGFVSMVGGLSMHR